MKIKELSNYEFFKKLYKAQEDAATGKVKTGKKSPFRECEFCHKQSKQQHVVRSELLGNYHEDSPFRFKYLLTCSDCKQHITRLDPTPVLPTSAPTQGTDAKEVISSTSPIASKAPGTDKF